MPSRNKKSKTIPLSEICSLGPPFNPLGGLRDASPPRQQKFPSYAEAAGALRATSNAGSGSVEHKSATAKYESLDEAGRYTKNRAAGYNQLDHANVNHHGFENGPLPLHTQLPDYRGSISRSDLRQDRDTDQDSQRSRNEDEMDDMGSGQHEQTPDTNHSRIERQVQQQTSRDDSREMNIRYLRYCARRLRCETCNHRHPAVPGFPLDSLLTQVDQLPITYTYRPCPVSRRPMVVYMLYNERLPLLHTDGGSMAIRRHRHDTWA